MLFSTCVQNTKISKETENYLFLVEIFMPLHLNECFCLDFCLLFENGEKSAMYEAQIEFDIKAIMLF